MQQLRYYIINRFTGSVLDLREDARGRFRSWHRGRPIDDRDPRAEYSGWPYHWERWAKRSGTAACNRKYHKAIGAAIYVPFRRRRGHRPNNWPLLLCTGITAFLVTIRELRMRRVPD